MSTLKKYFCILIVASLTVSNIHGSAIWKRVFRSAARAWSVTKETVSVLETCYKVCVVVSAAAVGGFTVYKSKPKDFYHDDTFGLFPGEDDQGSWSE